MNDRSKYLIAALCLGAAVIAFRLLPLYGSQDLVTAMANFAPLAALALCAGMFLPRGLAAGLTLGAFLISDVALNTHYGEPPVSMFSVVLILVLAATLATGWALRKRRRLSVALGGTVAGVALFYVATNTVSFFADPGYAKTLAGWFQAQSVGLPTYTPQTWVFGLRALLGNLVFALAFYMAVRPTGAKPQTAPAATAA